MGAVLTSFRRSEHYFVVGSSTGWTSFCVHRSVEKCCSGLF